MSTVVPMTSLDTCSGARQGQAPAVVDLSHGCALVTDLVGAKAAALARATTAGLPALPGFALTTEGVRRHTAAGSGGAHHEALRQAWTSLSDDGRHSLVVRSSSTVEDGGSQSMAGMFTSVLDVRGWANFVDAVDDVVRSGGAAPIAVLVQRFLEPAWGGVLFGADPVTGRTDRLVVAAVPGGPDRLVSGKVDGVQLTLSGRGRLREADEAVPAALRGRNTRRKLARLAAKAEATLGSPQDIEWAIEANGDVVLLQSRPITAIGDEARAAGPILGPGPVAETLALPLRPLEEDLWVPPLRNGLREALVITGANSARQLRESPIVVTVGGRVAADLELLGLTNRRRSLWSRLDPRPPYRRLKAAWRVGRLKVALPALANDLIDEIDNDLRAVPPLATLSPAQLLRLLRRSEQTLTALHGHEVLAGLLLADDGTHPTAASAALRVLAEFKANGETGDDHELVAQHPVLLSLLPPRISDDVRLPAAPAAAPITEVAPATGGEAAVREALRLRVRWVHELTGQAALQLGRVLVDREILGTPEAVANVHLDELASLVEGGGSLSLDLRRRGVEPGAPLPASFRLTEDGVVVPVSTGDREARGAGGGRGDGPVRVGADVAPSPGDVLVVRTLDPSLAPLLPGLGGLVSETGSVLSHLAILAREYGVPTVVGLAGATERFTTGTWVVVDGTTGEVSPAAASEWSEGGAA